MTEPAARPQTGAIEVVEVEAGPLADIARLEAADGYRKQYSPHTIRLYRSQWRKWSTWAAAHACQPIPATPQCVAVYLWERSRAVSLATVQAVAASIAAAHRAQGLADPTKDDRVRRRLGAIGKASRAAGRGQKQAVGLTESDIAKIEATACKPRSGRTGRTESAQAANRRGLVDIALIRIMFDALLRRAEAAALTWGDVTREPDGSGRLTFQRVNRPTVPPPPISAPTRWTRSTPCAPPTSPPTIPYSALSRTPSGGVSAPPAKPPDSAPASAATPRASAWRKNSSATARDSRRL